MTSGESSNYGFFDILYASSKIIKQKHSIEKNISEELLTIRTLVYIKAPEPGTETAEYSQLEKILAACTLQKNDYKVLEGSYAWHHFRGYNNIREVLLFGIQEADADISVAFHENQANRFDERTWIKTAALSEIANNQQLKNNLWQNALKPHFLG